MKTFARNWLLPPGIYKLLTDAPPSVKRIWGGARPEPIQLNPSGKKAATLDELRAAPFGEIAWVEADKVRVWGRALSWQQNQHVRYFKDGIDSYRRFFELHQPQNQFEDIMLDATKGGRFSPVSFPKYRTPWSFEWEYFGEGPLGASHGTHYHGPVSNKKLLWEQKRSDSIREAVTKHGFQKLDDDFIAFGEILIDESVSGIVDFRLNVINGYHRISLLVHLGWSLIPIVALPPKSWREVRLSHLPRWPGVLDGSFSEEAARAYFLAHFRDPTEELLPGW